MAHKSRGRPYGLVGRETESEGVLERDQQERGCKTSMLGRYRHLERRRLKSLLTQVIEYTLFQPGLFLDYLAFPYKTSKHMDPLQTVFDIKNRRALVVEGHEDAIMTLTTVADTAAVIARAVDYEGKWPTAGGICGNRVSVSQIIEIASKVRGMKSPA